MRRFIYCSVLLLLLSAGVLNAGPMALTTDGQLFKVWVSPEEGLVLSHVAAGAEDENFVIPETVGLTLDSVEIAIDENTGNVFIVWSDDRDQVSLIRLVVLSRGAWFGPETLGGADGVSASNPQLLLDESRQLVPSDDPDVDPVLDVQTFLHVVWWREDNGDEGGHALFFPLRLDDDGLPLFDESMPVDLQDLLPFGMGCDSAPDVEALAHPQLLRASDGHPLLFATDFSNCVFHLLSISYEVLDEDDEDMPNPEKRRRQIAVFNTDDAVMAIPPEIDLPQSKMLLGSDYSVLLFWDTPNGISWLISTEAGWSEVSSLDVGEELSHEQAVNLIRGLVH